MVKRRFWLSRTPLVIEGPSPNSVLGTVDGPATPDVLFSSVYSVMGKIDELKVLAAAGVPITVALTFGTRKYT